MLLLAMQKRSGGVRQRASAILLIPWVTPGVQNRGAVKGGRAVFIPARDGGPLLLVLDPATGLIRNETWPEATGQGSWNVLLAQWTNQLPKVVPLNKYYCSGG